MPRKFERTTPWTVGLPAPYWLCVSNSIVPFNSWLLMMDRVGGWCK